MAEKFRKKNIWVDTFQGEDGDGCAFGFVGTSDRDDEYCGWFFSYPRQKPLVTSEEDITHILGTLEADETMDHYPEIPHRWAKARLEERLREMLAKYERRCDYAC